MKTNMSASFLSAILIAAVLPSCIPVQGPPPGYGGGPGPNHQGNGPVPQQYGPTYHNGGAQYPGGYRQIGDPRRTVYGNGPQSYATWGPVPQIFYQGGPL